MRTNKNIVMCADGEQTEMSEFFEFVFRGIRIPLRNADFDYDTAAIDTSKRKLKSVRFPLPIDDGSFAVHKKSVDARKPNEIYFTYSVFFRLKEKVTLTSKKLSDFEAFCQKNRISSLHVPTLDFSLGEKARKNSLRPVVAGFGPAGMFCALALAYAGMCPIVLERGSEVEKRSEKVQKYWESGELDTESNVQFGEGGAGTFSDGKLMTRIHDPLCDYVLKTLYRHGADESILTSAKPHVGTDKLREIVKNIRKTIIAHGGEVHFDTKLVSPIFSKNGDICAVETSRGIIETNTLFLALGHSARDTFSELFKKDVLLVPKPFSVGVRIEHLQADIDRALYGKNYENAALPRGEYALSRRFGDRAVYSFCMCPGGTVVASASENGTIVTNGMSYSARDGKNANSAIAVSVNESDFGNDIFAAMNFQRNIEKAAYSVAKGAAPTDTLGHFLGKGAQRVGRVEPTYTGKTEFCDFSRIFPEFIIENLSRGFLCFEKNISGFTCDDAILTAPETRTSSPVRIPRNTETLLADSHGGLYPCGEGAGYAGGITSAAVDGLKCAMKYLEKENEV